MAQRTGRGSLDSANQEHDRILANDLMLQGVHTATMITRTRTVEEPQSSRSHGEIRALLGISTYLVPEYPKNTLFVPAHASPTGIA